MSGVMDITTHDDGRKYRYNQMLQMINNNSADPSMSGGSLYNFKLGNSVRVNTVHNHQNSLLAPQQFYKSGPIRNESEADLLSNPTANSVHTAYSQMESSESVFRLPTKTTKEYSAWLHYKVDIDLLMSTLQAIEDKARLKFLIRLFKNAIHMVHHQQYPISNPTLLLDTISNTIKDKYYSCGSKSVGASSVISESLSSNFEYGLCGERFGPGTSRSKDRNAISANDPRVMLTDFINSQSSKSCTASEKTHLPPSVNNFITQQKKPPNECSSNRNKHHLGNEYLNLDESCTSLFTESQIAQQRDENLANKYDDRSIQISQLRDEHNDNVKRKKSLNATPTLTKSRAFKKRNSNDSKKADKENSGGNNILMNNTHIEVPIGAKALSRRGRPIKSPTKFWQGNESKVHGGKCNEDLVQSDKVMLNDSMTLRNRKLGDRRSPACLESIKDKNMTPFKHTNENRSMKGKAGKPKTNGKENTEIIQNSKPTKNNDTKKAKSVMETKRKPAKKAESRPNKMISKKRKSEELDRCQPKTKKSKVFEDPSGNNSSDDELFGAINYKKCNKQALQALSPTSGIQSAKRAVGMMLSKETPPCKTLGLLMNVSRNSAASSVVKEAPAAKKNQPVKRVTKIIENKKVNNIAPSPTDGRQKEKPNSKIVQEQKSFRVTTTPVTALSFSTIMGNKIDSSDDDDYDDVDLQ